MKTTLRFFAFVLIAGSLAMISCSKENEIVEQQGLTEQTALTSTKGPDTDQSLTARKGEPSKGSLHLGIMYDDFKSKKRNFLMNVSMTSILNTGRAFPLVGYSLNEYTYWEVGSTGYWRADNRIKRSDSGFMDSDHFEVLVYPDLSAPELVDEDGVKVTWRSPEMGLHTFILEDVSVYYVTDGILINGSFEFKETPIGVSIAITPKS